MSTVRANVKNKIKVKSTEKWSIQVNSKVGISLKIKYFIQPTKLYLSGIIEII